MAPRPAPTTIGSLTSSLRRGATISAVALIYTQVISLAQTLVVARILSPEEVGWFTAGTVLAGFLVQFSEGGMRNALIQREHDLDTAANTVFWATLGVGVAWAGVVAVSTTLISRMFNSPIAGQVALVTAGIIVLHALTNVPDALLQRRFDFRQRSIVNPSVATSFAVVSIGLSLLGFGVWSLVIAWYVSLLIWLATTWWLAGWYPGKDGGRPSFRVWRELSKFSYPVVVSLIVDRGRELLETSIVGNQLGANALGQYRYGMRLAQLPGVAVVEVGSYVLFPAFARIAGDIERFKSAFLRSLHVLWLLTVPMAALVVAVGEPAVVVLLGDRWRAAGVMLVALAGVGPGVALSAIGMESIKAHGRTGLINWVTGINTVLAVGLLLLLLPWGLAGVGLAVSISSFTAGLASLLFARRLVGVTLPEIGARLIPPLLAAGLAGVAVSFVERLLGHADQHGVLLGLAILLAETLALGLVYLAGLRLLAPAAWRELSSASRKAGRSVDHESVR